MPNQRDGKPSQSSTHATMVCSNSVAAGQLFQSIAFTFSAEVKSSPKIPGADAEIEK